MDHLQPLEWMITPIYCDCSGRLHRLKIEKYPNVLYSNTPVDFEYKLSEIAEPFTYDDFIKTSPGIDIVFPVIHGEFGEGGDLQTKLKEKHIPFVGSSSDSCQEMFDKVKAYDKMKKNGFETLAYYSIPADADKISRSEIIAFLKSLRKTNKKGKAIKNAKTRVIVKPSSGGSSIGVKSFIFGDEDKQVNEVVEEILKYATVIRDKNYGGIAMIEEYCQGREFTVIVLESMQDEPVALLPTEVRLFGGDIFDFSKKYLPSLDVEYHCPPRFNVNAIEQIQKSAESLFKLFGMSDFSRIDGWLLKDGRILFSDINTISGLEQNSFLFVQGSRIGFTHVEILNYIVTHAATYYNKKEGFNIDCSVPLMPDRSKARKVYVLFGGETSEREVSVMSGTNVWLKLLYDSEFLPEPYLLTPEKEVWKLPYRFILNYTVEEIIDHCMKNNDLKGQFEERIGELCKKLGRPNFADNTSEAPEPMSWNKFLKETKYEDAFVFIALHGGFGEGGDLQSKLMDKNIAFNGPGENSSRICMDKCKAGIEITKLDPKLLIYSLPKIEISISENENLDTIWKNTIANFSSFGDKLIIKPKMDGSSTGIGILEKKGTLTYLYQSYKTASNHRIFDDDR